MLSTSPLSPKTFDMNHFYRIRRQRLGSLDLDEHVYTRFVSSFYQELFGFLSPEYPVFKFEESIVHQILQCVPWVVFIYYSFNCMYINYYSVSLGWLLYYYTGSTVHQLLQCVPWVVFIYRFHCTSTSESTVCLLGGLYIQVPLCINYYNVSDWGSLWTVCIAQ